MAAPLEDFFTLQIPKDVQVDDALAEYYKQCGRNDYYNKQNKGKFRMFVEVNGFSEHDIEQQLGEDSKDANDCSFINIDKKFPLNTGMVLNNTQEKNKEIFKILQNCYKYGVALTEFDDDEKYVDDDEESDEDDCEQEACIVGPDVAQYSKGKVGKNSYKYFSVSAGLNYSGTCCNRECGAFRQPVITPKGFGRFYPLQEQVLEEDADYGCRGCKTFFKLERFFLFGCDADLIYKKKDAEKEKFPYSAKGNDFVQFGSTVKDGVTLLHTDEFELLMFVVKPNKN